jgi:hypothetical protein
MVTKKMIANMKHSELNGDGLLTLEQRRELVGEAARNKLAQLLHHHRRATLGELVEGLCGDPHWEHLRDVPVRAVIASGRRRAR